VITDENSFYEDLDLKETPLWVKAAKIQIFWKYLKNFKKFFF